MSRKKIDRIETGLKVIDINAKGMGVAKGPDGAVYFINSVVPGDILDIRIYKKEKVISKLNLLNGFKNLNTELLLHVNILEYVEVVNGNIWIMLVNYLSKKKEFFII